ncbi:MAG: LysR family transcriptional regulator [Eubacterium sp.]|nr:LysR family transcriptional regulator [Eubacterium sp.]
MTHAQIEAFLAIYRSGTITDAADALMISQSSLSTRLHSLEEELGCLLFLRSRGSRTLALTPEGRQFQQLAVQYENLIERMYDIKKGQAKPVLRVSSINSLGVLLFPYVYDRFIALHPNVELEIQSFDTVNACENIEYGETDIAFTSGEYNSDTITALPVFSEPMVLLTGEDSRYPEEVLPAELDVADEVYLYWGGPFYAWHAAQFGEDAVSPLRISTMGHLYYFLLKKDKWAAVPLSVADALLPRGGLRVIRSRSDMPFRLIKCMMGVAMADSPLLNDLLDCIKEFINSKGNPDYTILF